MTYETILCTLSDDGIARVTLNRPDRLNSFNEKMHLELREALTAAQDDARVRVVVITGAGRGFCAGQDLNDRNVTAGAAPIDLSYTLLNHYQPTITLVSEFRCPVIAAVNGVAAGSGSSLALACDLIVAAESASFVQAFSKIGLIPDAGSTYHLPRALGPQRAMGLALTGGKLPAKQAESWGMVWKCVPDDQLGVEVDALAKQLAEAPPLAMREVKRALRTSGSRDLAAAISYEAQTQKALGVSNDYREGVQAFMQKRAPKFTGA